MAHATEPDELVHRDLRFLYPRAPGPGDTQPVYERSFFMLPEGSDVPPKFPDKPHTPTPFDIVVRYLGDEGIADLLSILTSVNRDWCHAVRKQRFHSLHLHPDMNFHLLLQVFHPMVFPYVRHMRINGRLRDRPKPNITNQEHANHHWLTALAPFIQQLCTHAPIDYVLLQSLSWGDVALPIRHALLQRLPGVRALGIHEVDFGTTNQLLRTLSAFPRLQFLQVWHANFHALTHAPEQLARKEPLLLSEAILGCAYTGLVLQWMLGDRDVLAVEELSVDVRDMYRDDARLARVLRKAGPWLKEFHYMEWGGDMMCEGTVWSDVQLLMNRPEHEPWALAGPVRYLDTQSDDDECANAMEIDEMEDMDEDPNKLIGDDAPRVKGPIIKYLSTNDTGAYDNAENQVGMVQVNKSLLLDDEEANQTDDGECEFRKPPFACAEDYGSGAFADELAERLDTPMLEQIEARVYWTSAFSLLSLQMLCLQTSYPSTFYRFDVEVLFESAELFDKAPWNNIDDILARASKHLPAREDEDSDLLMRVEICVRGWDVRGKAGSAKLQEIKQNLPDTVCWGKLDIELGLWARRAPGLGPDEWLD